ncbi:MAG: hypothetical protein BWY44_01196 [Candidatus Omnitrophica bacterium ADurb.Bin292]|nr:MAG: hypothetical protein BWY44_01196 [Candidatus Omnitrophica bacterium ADurb.Bin292]
MNLFSFSYSLLASLFKETLILTADVGKLLIFAFKQFLLMGNCPDESLNNVFHLLVIHFEHTFRRSYRELLRVPTGPKFGTESKANSDAKGRPQLVSRRGVNDIPVTFLSETVTYRGRSINAEHIHGLGIQFIRLRLLNKSLEPVAHRKRKGVHYPLHPANIKIGGVLRKNELGQIFRPRKQHLVRSEVFAFSVFPQSEVFKSPFEYNFLFFGERFF